MKVSLDVQYVSHCSLWFCDKTHPWLSRKWAATMPGDILMSLLTKVHLALRMWVATVTGSLSSPLTWLACNSAGSELLLILSLFKCVDEALLSASELQPSIATHQKADQAHDCIYSWWINALSHTPFEACWLKFPLGSAEGVLQMSLVPFLITHSWLCSLWVIPITDLILCSMTKHLALQKVSCTVFGTLLSILIEPSSGSAVCELFLPLDPFEPTDQVYPWLCREWVAAVPGTLSCMPIKLTLGSADCELLLSLTLFQPCWSSPLLALQKVSYCCPWGPFKPVDQAHFWLCSMWVTAVPGTLSSLLIEPTLDSVACELLLSLASVQGCWLSPPLTLQSVSCCCLRNLFKAVDQAHSWLCSMWAAIISDTLSRLWIKPTLGSADCELLLSLDPFQGCWPSLPLALQSVSYSYLWHPFKAVNQAHSWLCRKCVASVPSTLLSLLTMSTLGSVGSELLLCLEPFCAY